MSSWFALSVGALIVVIAFVIVRTVRKVMFDVETQMRGVNHPRRSEATREIIEQLKNLDVRCPRCGQDAFLLFGTGDGYKCDSCHHEFKGPPHPRMSKG